MSQDGSYNRPVLNPLLSLVTDPRPSSGTGRSKSLSPAKEERLQGQVEFLRNSLELLEEDYFPRAAHDGRVLVYAEMFEDSRSPTSTPDDLFRSDNGAEIITSMKHGYLVELEDDGVQALANVIKSPRNVGQQVDISGVNDIKPYSTSDIYTSEKIQALWEKATRVSGERRKVEFWLLPFKAESSRQQVAQEVLNFIDVEKIFFNAKVEASKDVLDISINQFKQKIIEYQKGNDQRFVLYFDEKQTFDALVAAEVVARLEPAAPFQPMIPPGQGKEPSSLPKGIGEAPVVGVIDGGVNAHSLGDAIAWRPHDPLVVDWVANFKHGNRVASIVVDATGWNNNVVIPDLPCRIVPLQILSKDTLLAPDDDDVLEYIEEQIMAFPDARVWNLSCTKPFECESDDISYIGSVLSRIARENSVLFVISAGNLDGEGERIAPPADCESALCVGGRTHDIYGKPEDPCKISRCGLGPYNLQKPEVSSLSTLRTIGGESVCGTSFAAPLISRLAAHTLEKVNNCTPDMARALIINGTDLRKYCEVRGWGTPLPDYIPWDCPAGTVTMTWTQDLETGVDYYWEDIVVPSNMVVDDKLSGEIYLTAVHSPRMNNVLIGNPILSRVEVSLQGGGRSNLLGSHVSPSGLSSNDAKWSPVRVHRKAFRSTSLPDGKVKVRARIYPRDKFSLTETVSNGRAGVTLPVSFALTFKHASLDANTYDLFVNSMRNSIESAVEIQLENEFEF